MLDIKYIRQNSDKVKQSAKNKNVNIDVDEILSLDEKRRSLMTQMEAGRAEQNKRSTGVVDDAVRASLKELKTKIKGFEEELEKIQPEFDALLLKVPNVVMDDVPVGPDASGNKEIRNWGKIPKFDFQPVDHVTLGEKLGLIDIERASKVTGTRFSYLKGPAALMEFALVQMILGWLSDKKFIKKIVTLNKLKISDKPFTAVVPPVMIRPDMFTRMARLSPEDKDERYYLPQDDLYLVGSAEHTLGSMHADEIIDEKDLPLRYIGFSTAFRREAGSYGKDTRGILRVHQFDKLEMESFTLAQDSEDEQELFVAVQEHLLQVLKLPYRVMAICTGDMGKPDARQIDIETWMPAQNTYRETHTADLMTDYQTRRLSTRVRRTDGTIEFLHTNDATASAIGRTIIAIIENYQTKKGTIVVPLAIRKYMGGLKEIK